ncbi:unnamed protein product [Acanthoscelides obtectus]|uniref:Uncharacterized protein n=1 Tax=Acanthoscelides obtectus TaxID=200917 RepID=A0A9P0L4W1_ACAOB|nr:unnamed protein product [Acanthoscelides obtectus]CAK1633025.1 hypothetical protein AOBTE_LOCUS7883 [Acanthoscelides obtectus]
MTSPVQQIFYSYSIEKFAISNVTELPVNR